MNALEARLIEWQQATDDPLLRPEYTALEPLKRRAGHAAASKLR